MYTNDACIFWKVRHLYTVVMRIDILFKLKIFQIFGIYRFCDGIFKGWAAIGKNEKEPDRTSESDEGKIEHT